MVNFCAPDTRNASNIRIRALDTYLMMERQVTVV